MISRIHKISCIWYIYTLSYICVCVCVYENPRVRKCSKMKERQSLQRMILFIKLFANVKRFSF